MIIKSLSRKSNSSQLIQYALRYVLDEQKNIPQNLNKQPPPLIIRHNIRSRTSVKNMIAEFQENEKLRLYKRKDSVQLYHTILSFGAQDKEQVTNTILKDIAKQYITLRGKSNLYVGAPHYDKDHTHLHLVVSGTKLDGRSSRVSKQQFKHIKLALEAYQKEQYPQLVHSVVAHEKPKRKLKEEIVQTIKAARQTTKQSVITSIDAIHAHASSLEDFLAKLQAEGHSPYFRNGKVQGIVVENTKFRFSRLGFDENTLQEFSSKKTHEETALTELQTIRDGRFKSLEKKEEMEHLEKPALSTEEKEESLILDELATIRTTERRKERNRTSSVEELEREESDTETSTAEESEDTTAATFEYDTSLTV